MEIIHYAAEVRRKLVSGRGTSVSELVISVVTNLDEKIATEDEASDKVHACTVTVDKFS